MTSHIHGDGPRGTAKSTQLEGNFPEIGVGKEVSRKVSSAPPILSDFGYVIQYTIPVISVPKNLSKQFLLGSSHSLTGL